MKTVVVRVAKSSSRLHILATSWTVSESRRFLFDACQNDMKFTQTIPQSIPLEMKTEGENTVEL